MAVLSSRAHERFPPQSPRGFSTLARLYYLVCPTKTAMLRRLELLSTNRRKGETEILFNFFCSQRLDIAKLNDLINKAEENMVQLRKRYERAVQERNDM